ncbi:hypothetical protein V1477_012338 [Vespula maculifrons]|uniref:Uncharacterized protein n=1 Tax=Vespula maculifrons TaxID=7453 RepID=A0ABD2BX71_VESMC
MKLKYGPSGRYYIKTRLISSRKAESVARLSLRSQVRNNNITSYLHNAENTFQRGWHRSEAVVYEKGIRKEGRVDPSSFKYHTGRPIICRYIERFFIASYDREFSDRNEQVPTIGDHSFDLREISEIKIAINLLSYLSRLIIGNSERYVRIPVSLVQIRAFE